MQHVRECSICQQNKSEHIHPVGLLRPLPILEQKWQSISMDFITRLPKVQGRDCLYVVVDRLTKFAHFFAISSYYSTAQVAELFFREVFRLHELPKTIVSDQDSRFTGAFWQEIFRLVGTKLSTSMSYHPQSDGKTKIVNRWIDGYLRNYVTGKHQTWIKWLYLRDYCYNNTYHMSIRMTPFKALYGYEALDYAYLAFEDKKDLLRPGNS